MPATVTLGGTTLKTAAGASDSRIQVSSISGLAPGTRLFVDGELMSVVSLGVGTWVNVLRGVDGTAASAHSPMSVVVIGRADQFYAVNPSGKPPASIPVSPYVNAINGTVWLAQGDPNGVRWWQQVTVTYGTGPLGIQTVTYNPTAST